MMAWSRMRAARWLLAPLLSVALLVASSYFFWWPLGFIALAPLFILIERDPLAYRRIAGAAFLIGFLYPLALMRVTLMGFTWLPEAHFFQEIIRFAAVPVALIIGGLYAGVFWIYAKKVRTRSLVGNAVLFALVWALVEWLVTAGTGGFNLGLLANAASSVTPLVGLAAIGGAHLVSFLVILVSGLVGAFVVAARTGRVPTLSVARATLGMVIAVIALYAANAYYLRSDQIERSISVAILQNSNRTSDAFGTFEGGAFMFPKLAGLIAEARASTTPEIIIYPFAVAKELLATGAPSRVVATGPLDAFAAWERRAVGTTTFVTWDTIDRDETFWNEIDYWQGGAIVTAYDKRTLLPFIDYTPAWAQQAGLYTTVVDEAPGGAAQPLFTFGTARIASAVCSEVSSAQTIRENVRGANVGFSIGSDAIFSDNFAARSDLVSAQFRAAENNVPVVRANRFGFSGFITAEGQVIRAIAYNADGAFVEQVPYDEHPRRTLYSITGDWLFIVAGIIGLWGAWIRRGHS